MSPVRGIWLWMPRGRTHWVNFFKRHLETILKLGIEAAAARQMDKDDITARVEACRNEFIRFFDSFAADPNNPARWGVDRVTILTLDQWRDQLLRKHGFVDAFIDLKNRENEKALPFFSTVCKQIDSLSDEEQFKAIIEGVFAGNIFDMGAEATAKAYLHAGPDFFATRQTLTKRPWLVDDYDAATDRFVNGPCPSQGCVFHRQRRQRFSAWRIAHDAMDGPARHPRDPGRQRTTDAQRHDHLRRKRLVAAIDRGRAITEKSTH